MSFICWRQIYNPRKKGLLCGAFNLRLGLQHAKAHKCDKRKICETILCGRCYCENSCIIIIMIINIKFILHSAQIKGMRSFRVIDMVVLI